MSVIQPVLQQVCTLWWDHAGASMSYQTHFRLHTSVTQKMLILNTYLGLIKQTSKYSQWALVCPHTSMRIFHPLHSCYMILTYAGCLFLYTSQWHHRYARVMLNFLWWHHNSFQWRHCHVTVTFSFSICEELIVQKWSPMRHSDISVMLLWHGCFITVTSLFRGQITWPAYVNMRKIDTRVVSRTLIDVCWQTR